MGAQGTGTIDFGATPAEEAIVVISVPGVISTSAIEAWFSHGDSTGDNGTDEHEEAAALCPISGKWSSNDNAEFKAMPIAMLGIGTFKFHYVWD